MNMILTALKPVAISPENLMEISPLSLSYSPYMQRFNGHFPGEPGLAGCPFNSPSPFIPGLCILSGQV